MREKRRTEKGHLPPSAYEVWLKAQVPEAWTARHRVASPDAYEVWVEQRAQAKVAREAKKR